MKISLGISNFIEEISSLSHSVVFLYFFAMITEEGFLSTLVWCKHELEEAIGYWVQKDVSSGWGVSPG